MSERHQQIIMTLAVGFGDLLPKVVFIGSGALPFYVDQNLAPELRPRDRIDILAKAGNISEYLAWEKKLWELGFVRHDPSETVHKRWSYKNIEMDLMPATAAVTGFHNPWFEEALFQPEERMLENGLRIKVFSTPYFLAAKLEALANRGNGDLRRSRDFEDLVYLIDYRPSLPGEVREAFYEVRQFINKACGKLLQRFDLEEGIIYALPIGEDESRVSLIRKRLEMLAGN